MRLFPRINNTTHGFSDGTCFLPSSELSHSILAKAISQVSLTDLLSSFRYCFRSGIDASEEIAPMASAAFFSLSSRWYPCIYDRPTSCLTIGSSFLSESTCSNTGNAMGFLIWPRQYASSCFSNAESSLNPVPMLGIRCCHNRNTRPFEIVWMAASDLSDLRVKRARNRLCRGTSPETLSSCCSRDFNVESDVVAIEVGI